MNCIWNQSRHGLDPFPGPFLNSSNCLAVSESNEVLFWSKSGFGITWLYDLVAKNIICKKYFFLSNV